MKLTIENIRSFYGKHEIDIRPITLLVGENSTGKTTALACLAAACNRESYALKPVIDRAPYMLGDFEAIRSRTRESGEHRFCLGLESREEGISFLASFGRDTFGQPELQTLEGRGAEGHFRSELQHSRGRLTIAVTTHASHDGRQPDREADNVNVSLALEEVHGLELSSTPLMDSLGVALMVGSREFPGKRDKSVQKTFLGYMSLFRRPFALTSNPTFSLAPIRSSPKPTYEPHQEVFDPEGGHVPFALAKTLGVGRGAAPGSLAKGLRRFGKESGLFQDVRIRRLGPNAGDPFKVMIKQGGVLTNLAYVGYGVSQSLPLVYEMLRTPGGARLLMQQPEVHLHPCAQAALGTLISELSSAEEKTFVIETHSDYLLDRIRQEVAKGTVSEKDVAILYFEKKGKKSKIRHIHLDEYGNILDAPTTYREFFMREELNLLGAGIE